MFPRRDCSHTSRIQELSTRIFGICWRIFSNTCSNICSFQTIPVSNVIRDFRELLKVYRFIQSHTLCVLDIMNTFKNRKTMNMRGFEVSSNESQLYWSSLSLSLSLSLSFFKQYKKKKLPKSKTMIERVIERNPDAAQNFEIQFRVAWFSSRFISKFQEAIASYTIHTNAQLHVSSCRSKVQDKPQDWVHSLKLLFPRVSCFTSRSRSRALVLICFRLTSSFMF